MDENNSWSQTLLLRFLYYRQRKFISALHALLTMLKWGLNY